MPGVLPPLYDPWVEEVIGGELPVERRAPCARCAMLPRGEADDPDEPFDASTKCCTYTPFLPNFLAGAILLEDGPPRRVLEARIDERAGVTPLGVAPTLEAHERYLATMEGRTPAFGRTPELRCPYYQRETGNCGVWRHRNGICSTWFCRHERGVRGRRFWKTVKGLLALVERVLMLHCLDELGLDPGACEALYLEGAIPPRYIEATHLAVWGEHLGAEAAFFVACARAVEGIGWARVLELGGEPLARYAEALRGAYHELLDDQVPPEVLEAGDVVYQIRRPGVVRAVSAAAPNDFVELPEKLVAALPRLARRSVDEALAELRGEGLDIDEATVRRLLDFQVLQ